MTLAEALSIASRPGRSTENALSLGLCCGFEPLHLSTFLNAYTKAKLDRAVDVRKGLYGDLWGNLRTAVAEPPDAAVVVLEWADLDPRLGVRSSGGWGGSSLGDVVRESRKALDRLYVSLEKLSGLCPLVFCGPTLPLAPIGHARSIEASRTQLELESFVASFTCSVAALPNAKAPNSQRLDEFSPPGKRFDVKLDLHAGFPYSIQHVSAVAGMLIDLLYPPPPRKGLITDLDETLWKGVLGEDGPHRVTWSLEDRAQVHALYQTALASLAEQGIMIAIASKNDKALVQNALAREDLLIPSSSIFPVEANWGPKSGSVARILRTWNVTSDSVVFVDDSPTELAEVGTAYPDIKCLQFRPESPQSVWMLLWDLRDLFGKSVVVEEDRLRVASLRNSAVVRESGSDDSVAIDFLEGLEGVVDITIDNSGDDPRSFELLNKTNQFNLNGRRFTAPEWRAYFSQPEAFLVSVSYKDKFGALGKIGAILGCTDGPGEVRIDSWAMSCRAFSRRIEHHTLKWLLDRFQPRNLKLVLRETGRNVPLREFLASLPHQRDVSGVIVSRSVLEDEALQLPHELSTTHDERGLECGSSCA